EAAEIRVPLACELLRHNVFVIRTALVVIEVGTVPKILDERSLGFLEQPIVIRSRVAVAEFPGDLSSGTQRSQVEAPAVGTFATRHPVVIGLVGESSVFNQAITVGVVL